MFNKPSLKNRFKIAESKLEVSKPELNLASELPEKARHPEIHAIAKGSSENELELTHYLRTIKKSFKRLVIPSPTEESLGLEEMICDSVNALTTKPNVIQIHHPFEAKGSDCFRYFVHSLEDYPHLWKLIFKDLNWVSLSYISNSTVITFSAVNIDIQKLEGVLKSICAKSGSLVSFNIQKKDNSINIHLRLEAYEHKKNYSEREADL